MLKSWDQAAQVRSFCESRPNRSYERLFAQRESGARLEWRGDLGILSNVRHAYQGADPRVILAPADPVNAEPDRNEKGAPLAR